MLPRPEVEDLQVSGAPLIDGRQDEQYCKKSYIELAEIEEIVSEVETVSIKGATAR